MYSRCYRPICGKVSILHCSMEETVASWIWKIFDAEIQALAAQLVAPESPLADPPAGQEHLRLLGEVAVQIENYMSELAGV